LGKKRSVKIFKLSFLLPFSFGILVSILFPELKLFGVVISIFSLARFLYVYNLSEESNFEKLRKKLGGVVEGSLYFVLNATGL